MKKGRRISKDLKAERPMEELREFIKDGIRPASNHPEFRRVATRVFTALADAWVLTSEEASALVGVSIGEYEEWRQGKWDRVGADQMERIFCLFGIYMNLCTLYSGHIDRVHRWLNRANNGPHFWEERPSPSWCRRK